MGFCSICKQSGHRTQEVELHRNVAASGQSPSHWPRAKQLRVNGHPTGLAPPHPPEARARLPAAPAPCPASCPQSRAAYTRPSLKPGSMPSHPLIAHHSAVPGPELPSNPELTPTATPAPHSVTSFSVPTTTRCLSPASTSSPRQAGQLCSSSLHVYGGLGIKPGEEGSAGQCARQGSRTGRQRSPERAGDSARVTQQEAAETRQPGVSSSHCIKPSHPRSCLSSFLPEPQDPKCLGDVQRAGKGQEAGREGVG